MLAVSNQCLLNKYKLNHARLDEKDLADITVVFYLLPASYSQLSQSPQVHQWQLSLLIKFFLDS